MKGGGKEGQGPGSKSRKEKDKPKKDMANIAREEGDGVWMVIASDSGDKHMGDDEFNDFEVIDKDPHILKNMTMKMKFPISPLSSNETSISPKTPKGLTTPTITQTTSLTPKTSLTL